MQQKKDLIKFLGSVSTPSVERVVIWWEWLKECLLQPAKTRRLLWSYSRLWQVCNPCRSWSKQFCTNTRKICRYKRIGIWGIPYEVKVAISLETSKIILKKSIELQARIKTKLKKDDIEI